MAKVDQYPPPLRKRERALEALREHAPSSRGASNEGPSGGQAEARRWRFFASFSRPGINTNCDGAIFQDMSLASLRVVVCDSDGFMIEALLECIGLPPTMEDLEALACRRAISFAIKISLQDVVFEGDSEVIYKHIISDSPCLAALVT